jgi:hypothetical protein
MTERSPEYIKLCESIRERITSCRDASEDERAATAYDLAGLLADPYVASLDRNDPVTEILELAGELELPKHHRSATATWRRIEELADKLPSN